MVKLLKVRGLLECLRHWEAAGRQPARWTHSWQRDGCCQPCAWQVSGGSSLQGRGLLCPTGAEVLTTVGTLAWHTLWGRAGMSQSGSSLIQEGPTSAFYNASGSEGSFTGFRSIKCIKCCSLCIYYLTGGSHSSLRHSQRLYLPGHTCLEYMPHLFPYNLPVWNLVVWSKWQTISSSSLKKCVWIPSFSLIRGAL